MGTFFAFQELMAPEILVESGGMDGIDCRHDGILFSGGWCLSDGRCLEKLSRPGFSMVYEVPGSRWQEEKGEGTEPGDGLE